MPLDDSGGERLRPPHLPTSLSDNHRHPFPRRSLCHSGNSHLRKTPPDAPRATLPQRPNAPGRSPGLTAPPRRSRPAAAATVLPLHLHGPPRTVSTYSVALMFCCDSSMKHRAISSSCSASRRADACNMLDGAREDVASLCCSATGQRLGRFFARRILSQLARHTRDATLDDARGNNASCTAHQACVRGAHRSACAC